MPLIPSPVPSSPTLLPAGSNPTYPDLPLGSGWTPHSTTPELAYHPNSYGLMYNRAGSFLCCLQGTCQTALTPQSAIQHLKDYHSKGAGTRFVGNWIQRFKAICALLGLPRRLPTQLQNIRPFAGFKVYPLLQCILNLPGSETELCLKLFNNNHSFRTHLSKDHQCGKAAAPKQPCFQNAFGQQFYYNGPYFSVIPTASHLAELGTTHGTPPANESSSVLSGAGSGASVPQWLANLDAAIGSSLQTPNLSPGDTRVVEEWIVRLGWNRHLSQYADWVWLESLVELPTEKDFPWLRDATLSLFQNALDLISWTPTLSLKILQSPPPPSADVPQNGGNKPFSKFRAEATVKKYSAEISRFIAFLLRTKKNPLGSGGEYSLHLPSSITSLIDSLKNLPRNLPIGIYAEGIQALLFHIWTADWVGPALSSSALAVPFDPTAITSSAPSVRPAPPISTLISDPTIHCIILRSIRADGWVKARMVTNPLAKYTFAVRAVMLRHAHKQSVQTGSDIREELRKLQVWYTDKALDSTFTEVRNAQHLISAFAFSQKPTELPHIVWSESSSSDSQIPTEGIFLGKKFQLEAVPMLARSLVAEAYRLLKDEIFLGLDLRAEYTDITDNLTERNIGYFFLAETEPGNATLRTTYRHALIRGIIGNPKLTQEFVSDRNPVTQEPIWNQERLKEWYRNYSTFNSLIATLVLIVAGSPCRGTELTCIQYRNAPSRKRGLYYSDKRIIVATQYSKMSSISGQEKLIPHALDGLTSDLLVQRIVVADAFAQLVAHIAFPDDPNVKELLHSYLFVDYDRPFDSQRISQVLSRFTRKCFGFPMGIQRWRHFSISLRRKLCPEFAALAAIDSAVHTVGASQAGHSHLIESRAYGSSQWSHIGYQEDTYSDLLKACSKWQSSVLGLQPGGGEVIPFTMISSLEWFELILKGPTKSSRETHSAQAKGKANAKLRQKKSKLETEKFSYSSSSDSEGDDVWDLGGEDSESEDGEDTGGLELEIAFLDDKGPGTGQNAPRELSSSLGLRSSHPLHQKRKEIFDCVLVPLSSRDRPAKRPRRR